MAAALAAARLGARVEIVEGGERLGGTMANALLHTLAGLYGSAGELLNGGLAAELLERLSQASGGTARQRRMGRVYVQSVDPTLYREVVEAWVAEEQNILVSTQSVVSRPEQSRGRIGSVAVRAGARERTVTPRAVVDATGNAAVFRGLGLEYLQPSGPPVAGGLVFRLRGVEAKAVKFPRSVGIARAIQDAVSTGELPPDCERAWLDVGIFEDEAFVKLFVHSPETTGAEVRSRNAVEQLARFLRGIDGFEGVTLAQVGEIGIRENGRARGQYCLTEADVRSGASFADVACRCAWPIEHWDAAQGLTLEYLPDGVSYDIPLSALKAAGVDNLWVAGKCLSAEPRAQASARCVGTCWAMGEAVGRAAVSCLGEESRSRNER
jgi:hypothetical protein